MIDHFLESYGTEENFLRAYGGRVEIPEPQPSKNGSLSIAFSRPLVFPQSLISPFDSNYVEVIPELRPTEEELAEIREAFEQFQEDLANRPETTLVTKERTVCTEITVNTGSSSSGKAEESSEEDYEEDEVMGAEEE